MHVRSKEKMEPSVACAGIANDLVIGEYSLASLYYQ